MAEPVIEHRPGWSFRHNPVFDFLIASLVLGQLLAVFIEDQDHVVFQSDYFVDHLAYPFPELCPSDTIVMIKYKYRIKIK